MNNDPAMGDLGYERIEHDLYETPEWCSEAIIPSLKEYILNHQKIWEPSCGLGKMSEVLKKHFKDVFSTDIVDRGYPDQKYTSDFLKVTKMPDGYQWIVTNPPYGKLLDPFIAKALELTKAVNGGVALLMRNEVDSAANRRKFFHDCPAFAEKFVLNKRPRWVEYKPGDAAPRHNYAWYLFSWDKNEDEYPIIRYGK